MNDKRPTGNGQVETPNWKRQTGNGKLETPMARCISTKDSLTNYTKTTIETEQDQAGEKAVIKMTR